MYITLIFLIIGLFVSMVFLNVYFRVKVLKVYKQLINNKVEFTAKHIFNKQLMSTEVLPKYPAQTDNILLFVSHIRYSIKMAIGLIIVITILGSLLMYYK